MTHLDMVGPVAAPSSAQLVSVDEKHYPLESAAIAARAEGGFAISTLAQTYANHFEEPLEVVYTLPLPADGAVLGYTITVGDKVIRAEVQARDKAARAYKQALYEGRTAGLLEQSRPDTFQQSLGNVPPKTSVKITIDVLHPVSFRAVADDGSAPWWEYRFPTVVGVRYSGEPGRVKDAEELSPDRADDDSIPTTADFTLTIADEFGGSASCSTHRASVVALEGGVTLSFDHDEALDRDIVVRWDACAAEAGVRVVEGGGLPGDDGRYALVTVVPPAAPRVTYARDLTLLIDASGSMTGLPLGLAKRVAGDLLRSLREGDRFEVLAFASKVRPLTKGVVEFEEESLELALAALKMLRAGGCTEMASAVKEALAALREDSQRQVVLITDGEIGFESEVVAEITAAANVRLHVAGVGSVPNRSLTQQAAAAGRGVEVFAGDERQAHEASRLLVAATAQPVLTNVRVSGTAIEGDAPARLHDVLAGQPLAFTVELSKAGGTLEVCADVSGVFEPWRHAFTVPASHEGALAASPLPLGALYGRTLIAEIEREPETGRRGWGDPRIGRIRRSERDQRIEQLGLRHQIASSQTSLIAISEDVTVDPTKRRRRERLAVELPHGVSAEGVGLEGGFDRSMICFEDALPVAMMAFEPVLAKPRLSVPPAPPKRRAFSARVEAHPRRAASPLRFDMCQLVRAHWLNPGELELILEVHEDFVKLTEIHHLSFGPMEQPELSVVAQVRSPGRGEDLLMHGDIITLVLAFEDGEWWPAGMPMRLVSDGQELCFEMPQPYGEPTR